MKRLYLSPKDRDIINNALAFLLAGEFDESAGSDASFTREDAERTHEKIRQARLIDHAHKKAKMALHNMAKDYAGYENIAPRIHKILTILGET